MRGVCVALLIAVVVCGAEGELFAGPARYAAESTVLLNDVQRRDRELGYKIKAELIVAPVWREHHSSEFLLRFQLHKPKLYLKGKHLNAEFLPQNSVLDSFDGSTFYVHLKNGFINSTYLDPTQLPDVQNYIKSLISLFQFQTSLGEHNETDISGECHVFYETLSENVFRKIKRVCEHDGARVWARRVTRFTLAEGALADVHAEEVLALGHEQLGVKARSWITLHALAHPPPPSPPDTVPRDLWEVPEGLQAAPMRLVAAQHARPRDQESLAAAVAAGEAALRGEGAGGGGGAGAAAAALRLLPALREAPLPDLRALLQREDVHHLLPGLVRALGLAGTLPGLRAADELLQLRAEDPVMPHALLYLEGFALAPAPDAAALAEVLRAGLRARAPRVAEAALLAAAGAARRAGAAAAEAVRDALLRALAACGSEECRRVRVAALGNTRRADVAEAVLAAAERAGAGWRRVAALHALEGVPAEALDASRLDRLTRVALHRAAPLEVRAAALDLVVRRRAAFALPLAGVARELHARGPHELRRVFWQRLHALAPRHLSVRQLLALLEPRLRTWDARALAGSSSVLERALPWRLAGWSAALASLQLAHRGLLRRGLVRLLAVAPDNSTADLLAVEVWTRGIEALAGAGGPGAAEPAEGRPDEGVAGGLALSVAGTRMPAVTLFEGQAELLGHVWAGAGSTPTPALRALWVPEEAEGAVGLLGGAVLRHGRRAAVALALDAQAQVSLWWRTARCQLELRAGGAALVEAALATGWGEVRATALVTAEPRLRVAADLDFYDAVSLCVRVSTERHEVARNVSLWRAAGGRVARRWREEVTGAAGVTLSLAAPNDRVCRSLRADDDP